MKRIFILFCAAFLHHMALNAQIKFNPKIDVNFVTDTLMYPGSPLNFQVLFKGGFDMVETTPTYGNPAGKAVAKSWNDFIGFTPDVSGESLGWISVNHEEVVKNDKIGDGGGMTVFRVKRDPNTDTLVLVEQSLKDGRKGVYFNVDFANITGETGMNCGGIVSMADGRIWTAEEWFRYSNKDLADRDTSDFVIGQGTLNGSIAAAGFPGFNGAQIKKYQNYNFMTEIDPRQAKAVRKQYNWGRQGFEGGVILKDNKTVFTGADATPGFFTKFVADVPGDFTKGKTYVYRQNDQNVRLSHFSSVVDTYAEISAYDDVNDRIYSTESNTYGVTVFSLKSGVIEKIHFIDLSANGAAPTSVAVNNGILAVALPNAVKTNNGTVQFYDKNYTLLKTVTVGALPDMITYSPDGKYVIVANEAEPSDDYSIDPEGTVSVINLSTGIASATVSNAGFAGVNLPTTVRVFGQKKTTATDLYFSEYAEGSSNHKYLEIYNGTSKTIALDNYAIPNVSNGPTTAGEYEFWNNFPSGASIKAGETYIVAHPNADQSILSKANTTLAFLSNGNDGFCLVKGGNWTDANSNGLKDAGEVTGFTSLDCVGDWTSNLAVGWDVAGVKEATKDHTLIRKPSATGNADWSKSAGTDEQNSEWMVKDIDYWANLGKHSNILYSTPEQDLEPEYVAVSADSKTAYISLQENNAIAVLDIASAKITKVMALGFKDLSLMENALDVSDKDNKIGNQNTYKNLYGVYMPDAIAITEIGGQEYIVTANEGDSRDYPGFSEELRVKDLKLDPTAFPNAADLQKDAALGRLKTTSTMGDKDGDGDYDEIYSFGGRSFSIWKTDGTLVFDSKNEFEKLLATKYAANYPLDRDDDKGPEPESVVIGKLNNKTFAFIGCERSTGVMVYDISDPAKATFVNYYNKNGVDKSPEGLIFISRTKSDDGSDYLISTNEVVDPYKGSVSVYKVNGLDGKKWVEINNKDLDKMLNFDNEALQVGASMFNRLEWVTYDEQTNAIYVAETGRDNPGSAFAGGLALGGVLSNHTVEWASALGTTADKSNYIDYYGRVLKFNMATEEMTVHLEGGPSFTASPTINNYPQNHLSNPDGLTQMTINGKSYLVICEDLNGTSAGRVPAGISTPTCELYLLDLSIAIPKTDDLIRIAVSPYGSEITGACPTPDGKTLLVNLQHPNAANPFPFNYSLTFALNGWDLEKLVSVHEIQRQNQSFNFYPNPSNGVVTFKQSENVAVYGADGRIIESFENVTEISLWNYASGLYYLGNDKGAIKKLILNK